MTTRGSTRWTLARCVLLALTLLAPARWVGAQDGSSSHASGAASTGTKRALLVGINAYKAVPHLMGSLNDVAAMRQILITRWGFSPEHITVLTEQDATRAAILAALRQLVRESGPNDTMLFHFSGHGSQVQDLDGDEDDGLDETLVPYDGRTKGVPDIVDDELDRIFAQLHAGASLIILDSCHSGTATRALDFRTRGIPQDMRIDLYKDEAPATGTRAIVPRVESRVLVMSAVADNEEALDGPIDGDYHGIFTYALSRSLAVSPPGASPREVFGRVSEEMKRLQSQFGRISMPEPQLEGPPALLDRSLLAAAAAPSATASPASLSPASAMASAAPALGSRLAWIEVQPGSAGQATLVRGVLLGAAPGSTWAIYPPGETAFASGHALTVATVAQAAGLDALASLQPAVAVAPGSRAVALMPASAAQRIPVRILDAPESRRRQVEDLLSRSVQDVELVGPDRTARFLIDPSTDTLRLLTADGRQVLGTFDTRSDQWGPAVARVITRSTNASALLSLENPTSQLRVSAQVVGAASGAARDIVVVADSAPAQLHIRRQQEPRSAQNSLQLAITVNQDAYLTIVDVDSEGNANLLFPNSYQRPDFLPDGRISANQSLWIPDGLAPGSRAGFFWDYGPPAGIDTIRIFASTDAATARMIRERIHSLQPAGEGTRGLTPATTVTAGLTRLRSDLTTLATRGIVTVQDAGTASVPLAAGPPSVADWTATSVTVAISP